jgi:HK97 family phage major capsid protein
MGNMTIPRQHLGSTGAFFSEGAQITVSQLAFDNIQMTWKKYGAMTYTSRELLDFTPLNAAGIIANDLTSRLGLLEDRTLLFGSSPIVGITGSLASGNTIANSTDSSAVTFQTVSFDLQNLELQLTGNLVQGTFYWIMHPGVVAFLKQLSSTFGVYPFKAELDTGYLNGHRVLTTVQLPTNLGASAANETNILLVCGEQCILGDAYRWAISMTTEGSFVDSSTQVHTFGQDLVAFKATNSIDFSLMHNVSAACLQASNWALSTVGGFDAYTGQAANTAGSSASSASS